MTTFTRLTLPAELAHYQRWACPDIAHLSCAEQRRFGEVKQAIELYLSGAKVKTHCKVIGLSHGELLRRLNRCVGFDDDGLQLGWYALLPNVRVSAYRRIAPVKARPELATGGYSGALTAFWEAHPLLRDRFERFLLTGKRDGSVPESRVTPATAHEYFLQLCTEIGFGDEDWPFCVAGLGVGAVKAWVKDFLARHHDAIVARQYGDTAKVKSATQTGHRSRLRTTLPFDVVEMDEHTIDLIASLGIDTPKGVAYVPIKRLQIIVIVDRFSQAVLAYTVIVRRKVKAADIVATVAKAVSKWQGRKMSLRGFAESISGGFPSERIAELEEVGFGMLLLDNDTAHHAEPVMSQIALMAGCAVNYGRVAHFERRPIVESLFKRLAQAFHRLPSTTGTGPGDSRRRRAEAAAVEHRIELSAVLDLVEAVIADHNSSRPNGNLGATPLEVLQRYVTSDADGFLPPRLPPQLPHEPKRGLSIQNVRIGGSAVRGERPHVVFDRVRYTSPELSRRSGLVGRSATVHFDENNIVSLHVVLDDGECIGPVHATGVWADHPHSREARRLIHAELDAGRMARRRGGSIVAEWLARLGVEATQKSSKTKAPVISKAANYLAEERLLGNAPSADSGARDAASAAPKAHENTVDKDNGRPGNPRPVSSRPVDTASSAARAFTLTPFEDFSAIN